MRVLIVEDEVRLAATLQDLMEMDGYTADTCHDGETGLDNALTGIYDVMILDVMLPKMDGFTVLRRLRAQLQEQPTLRTYTRTYLTQDHRLVHTGPDAHRPLRGHRQGDGAGLRGGLLPHPAL